MEGKYVQRIFGERYFSNSRRRTENYLYWAWDSYVFIPG
jgi:hypothetical protein